MKNGVLLFSVEMDMSSLTLSRIFAPRGVRKPCLAFSFFALLFLVAISLAQAATDTITSSGNWIAPAGVTSITVEVWGGGGAGGGQNQNSDGGGGGGGGAYSRKNTITVIPGNSYVVSVGAGGAGVTSGTGGTGGDSFFINAATVMAKGGVGGAPSTGTPPAGGLGGAAASGVGDVKFSGGNGGRGRDNNGGRGGPGGSSAGTAANGTSGPDPYSTQTAAAAPAGGGVGGDGGGGGNDGSAPASGNGGGGGGSGDGNSMKGGAGAVGKVVVTYVGTPTVSSINRASFDPTAAGKSVSWTVIFTESVTGVDAADFTLLQTLGVAGATITLVTGSNTTWTVTANTGTGSSGSLGLKLVDNDSIVAGALPLGGAGAGNGDFTGQSYTLLASVCTGAANIIFCDDFERSNPVAVGNGWTVTPANAGNCTGVAGNTGCAGIDSDIPPFNTYANPRANSTRSMFTRWSVVSVDSPVISLAGKTGAQLSFWMRRGGDAFSEYPEAAGENYLVQYFASDSTWKILAQYPSGVMEGQVFTPVIELPPDALHAGFKMRFYQPSGSGDAGGGATGGAPGVVGYDYWHMDDVVIREVSAPSYVGAFCDNFEAGLGRWSISAEGAPAGATIGDASIGNLAYQSASHELDMRWGYVAASTFKTDMTGVGGNITYWVRSGTTVTRDPVAKKDLVVEYLNSSGAWITLATYLGSVAAGTAYSGSHVIPADAKHPNFRLRFRKLAGSGYDKSYWHIDDACVGDLLPTADLALTKTGGTLVPGSNTTYTLKVTNNGPGTLSGAMQIVDTLPSGLSYLGASGTGWVCGANGQLVSCDWTGTLGNGLAASDLVLTVAVGAGVSGSVTNTATVTGTVNDNVPGNNTASYTSGNFVPAYIYTDKACVSGIAIGQPGQPCNYIVWSPQTAGTAKAGVFITAVNASNIPTQLSATAATTVGFQFGLTCHDPIANAGVQATFSAASSPTLPLCTGSGAEPTTWSASTNLSFAATSPSVATSFSFSYADAGEVELFMRNAAATSQKGTSGKFVVKPAGFVLSGIKCSTANAANCGAGALAMPTAGDNPGAATAAGSTFIRAGQAFSVTVTALTASGKAKADAGTAVNCVTVPADCTLNFGKEKVPESVRLNPTNVIAGMVTPPDVAGIFGAFSGGVAGGTTFSWEEVGIVTLTAKIKDGDYLGAGDVTGTTSGNVGRFYPDHFVVTVTPMCGGFVYSGRPAPSLSVGQPFTVEATAMNALSTPTKTSNYTDKDIAGVVTVGLSRAVNLTLSAGGATGKLYVDSTQGGAGAIPLAKFVSGAGKVNYTDATGKISFVFDTFPTTLTPLQIHADDVDSATSIGVDGSITARAGRLTLANAYGSELLDLPVSFRAEFWNGTSWVFNSADTCTGNAAFGAGNATTVALVSVPVALPTCIKDSGSPGLSGAGCAAVAPSARTFRNGASAGFAGDFNLWLQAPGAGHPGSSTITATVPVWLRFPWTGAGSVNPTARATFGIYKTPLIYRRENY
jgi:uncharacterized repeat protein (TIGR01451 family)